jgi:hypothetical protein
MREKGTFQLQERKRYWIKSTRIRVLEIQLRTQIGADSVESEKKRYRENHSSEIDNPLDNEESYELELQDSN